MSQFIGINPPPVDPNHKKAFSLGKTSPHSTDAKCFIFPHYLGTKDIIIQCFTEDGIQVQPAKIQIIDKNHVYVVFSIEQNGRCMILA